MEITNYINYELIEDQNTFYYSTENDAKNGKEILEKLFSDVEKWKQNQLESKDLDESFTRDWKVDEKNFRLYVEKLLKEDKLNDNIKKELIEFVKLDLLKYLNGSEINWEQSIEDFIEFKKKNNGFVLFYNEMIKERKKEFTWNQLNHWYDIKNKKSSIQAETNKLTLEIDKFELELNYSNLSVLGCQFISHKCLQINDNKRIMMIKNFIYKDRFINPLKEPLKVFINLNISIILKKDYKINNLKKKLKNFSNILIILLQKKFFK